MFNSIQKKWMTSYKLNSFRTQFYQLVAPCDHTKVIFIFGCQRSGTTMMGTVVGLSPAVKAYGEGDLPYFYQEDHHEYLRLVEWQKIKELLRGEKSQFTLLKPLYDSQVADKLLKEFPYSKAIWIYRHYLDTVDSHIKNYRNDHDGIIYTKELFDRKKIVWKNENLSEDIKEIIDKFKGREINSATGYALFWLTRNSLFNQVKKNADILLVNYESIIANPVLEFSNIFSFLCLPFKKKYAGIIHSRALKKPIKFLIDPEVQQLCDEMYNELKTITYLNSIEMGLPHKR